MTVDAPPLDASRHVIVTGPSGAGRTTAIHALEDMGFEAIDNMPLSLVRRLLQRPAPDKPLALGIDVRNRDFSTAALIDLIAGEKQDGCPSVQLLYLDSTVEVLLRRFSETRRRHPLAPSEDASVGIARELDLLGPLRRRADILLETTEMSPHDLRAELERWFAPAGAQGIAVSLHSFSYKRGLPRGLDMVFDCRFLRNPYWEAELRYLDGQDARVAAHVADDPRFPDFCDRVTDLALLLLPAFEAEGKAYLSIGFGCTGGRHRSVVMARTTRRRLVEKGWLVSVRHRELERLGDQGVVRAPAAG